MRCEKCVAEENAKKTTWRHRLKCTKWFETAILGEDYVKCAFCGIISRQLTQHVKKYHSITKKQYISEHGPIACLAASKVRSQTNKYKVPGTRVSLRNDVKSGAKSWERRSLQGSWHLLLLAKLDDRI